VNRKPLKLSPSDFAFLWDECRRCFYLKVVSGFPRPRGIMPKIFSRIDGAMKSYFAGKRTEDIASGLPAGTVAFNERWVESKPIQIPAHSLTVSIRGKFDTALGFDDGTFGVVDFKTSAVKEEHVQLYGRQLQAYAHALENPSEGQFGLRPISKLGLIVYEPRDFAAFKEADVALTGSMTWSEIPRDEAGFMDFLREMVELLERPTAPPGSPSCVWCQYRDTSRRVAL
jgi:hypothetical protein